MKTLIVASVAAMMALAGMAIFASPESDRAAFEKYFANKFPGHAHRGFYQRHLFH